jgi:hypothetical protein
MLAKCGIADAGLGLQECNVQASNQEYPYCLLYGKNGWQDTKVKGLPDSIDPSKYPRNYWYAMPLPDAQERAEANDKEYMGIAQFDVFKTVRMEKGMKIMGMTMRTEYKVTSRVFSKFKVRLCVRGDQQEEGLQFNQRYIYCLASPQLEVC